MIIVANRFVKVALRQLHEAWPGRLSCDTLAEQARSRMNGQLDQADFTEHCAYLADMLLLCHSRGLIELHQLPPRCVWEISNLPVFKISPARHSF